MGNILRNQKREVWNFEEKLKKLFQGRVLKIVRTFYEIMEINVI